MSKSVEVVCPRCRKKHVNAMLYVGDNLCPRCGGIYTSAEIFLARKAVRPLYRPVPEPRMRKAEAR